MEGQPGGQGIGHAMRYRDAHGIGARAGKNEGGQMSGAWITVSA
jgi:hypothetical protein